MEFAEATTASHKCPNPLCGELLARHTTRMRRACQAELEEQDERVLPEKWAKYGA